MDFAEILILLGNNEKAPQDLSLMLNFQRMKNGATRKFLGME